MQCAAVFPVRVRYVKVKMPSIRSPAKPSHSIAQIFDAGYNGADTKLRCQLPCRLDDHTSILLCLPAHGCHPAPTSNVCLSMPGSAVWHQGPSLQPKLQQAAQPSQIHLLHSLLSLQSQKRSKRLHLLEDPCCCSPACHTSPARSEGCAGRPLIHCQLTGPPGAPAERQHTCMRSAGTSHQALKPWQQTHCTAAR